MAYNYWEAGESLIMSNNTKFYFKYVKIVLHMEASSNQQHPLVTLYIIAL